MRFSLNGVTRSITIASGDYTPSQLVDSLQAAIDTACGVDGSHYGGLKVSLSSGNKLTFTAGLLNDDGEAVRGDTTTLVMSNSMGSLINAIDTVKTTGKGTTSNALMSSININDTTNTFSMYVSGSTKGIRLQNGSYDRDNFVSMLNSAMLAQGLPENLVLAQVGGVSSGVANSNDDKALVFKLNTAINLPDEGEYIIDGVGGKAAFSVFYQTDGEIEVSYTKGAKDISQGVKITSGKNDFAFEVDGTKYEIRIPSGEYTQDELIDKINELIPATGAKVVAEAEDGRLKLNMSKYGSYTIGNVSGAAAEEIFFDIEKEDNQAEIINIQYSNERDDNIGIEHLVFSTSALGINTVGISSEKYAKKAVDRIAAAIESVSEKRSYYGALQNRMEYSIRNNENKEENLSSAESLIRDANMADEMFGYSKLNILTHVNESMLAQANQANERVLSLLG